MTLLHRKPASVTAYRWHGDDESYDEIEAFAGVNVRRYGMFNQLTEETDQFLVLRAGVDGAQGWVPVPGGHWVAGNGINDFWPIDDAYVEAAFDRDDAVVAEIEQVYVDVAAERCRAHLKHKDKPGGSMEQHTADDRDWFPVLAEEVGEVAREINDYRHGLIPDGDRWPRLRKELVQVAAMACAWISAIDHPAGRTAS